MITIWLLGFALICLCMGGYLLAGLFASVAILGFLCKLTYIVLTEG